jgi:hypothetical protein
MESKKARTTVIAVYRCANRMKWANLENRSTTVRIIDLPLTRGSPSTKSMDRSVHTVPGRSSSWSKPTG